MRLFWMLPGAVMALFLVTTGCESNNRGKIEGTTWSCMAGTVKGRELPADAMQIEFASNGKLTVRSGLLVVYTGTYSLGMRDHITMHLDQEVEGKKLARTRITIDGNTLTMTDPDGTTIKYRRIAGPAPPAAVAGPVSAPSSAPTGPPPPPPPPAVTPSAVTRPEKAILFQPKFVWAASDPSLQGTGFFAKAPNGKVVGVTSAHFLNQDGPALLEAQWLAVCTKQSVATFTQSWGPPGNAGTSEPAVDLRPDYLLMPAPEGIPEEWVLRLDSRPRPDPEERIWFPNKEETAPLGYQLLTGKVIQADAKYILVALDQTIEMQSQSGSPLISQVTGEVIGTLSRGGVQDGKTVLLLAPASSLVEALAKHQEFPLLRDVIGKRSSATAQRPSAAPSPPSREFRTWSDASGKHQIDAQLVSRAQGKVRLKKRDGQLVEVPFDKLCEKDRAYLAATMPSSDPAGGEKR